MMHRKFSTYTTILGLSLALAACGDDSGESGGDGTGGGTGATDGSTGTATTTTTSTSTAGDTSVGSDTDSGGSTTAGSSGTAGSTTGGMTAGSTTGGMTAGSTTGGMTTGSTTGGTTAGSSTGGMSGGTTGGVMACPLAQMHQPCDDQDNDLFHAIGLNCTSLGGNFDNTNAVPIANEDLQYAQQGNNKPWRVGTKFAEGYLPQEGEKLLVISTSWLPGPDGGQLGDPNASEDVASFFSQFDADMLPPPAIPVDGDQDPDPNVIDCDLMGDCTNTIQTQWEMGDSDPNDQMWFKFDVTAPSLNNGDIADANGYKFDFAFLSREFPEWVNTQYNDMFIVWQASSMFTGNVVFINDQPITVTALWDDATGVDYIGQCPTGGNVPEIPGCVGNAPELAGTELQTEGAGTGWYTATGGVEPGETFTLVFTIFDMGDSVWDSYAVIDNWRWDCEGCVPNEVNDCGIAPQ